MRLTIKGDLQSRAANNRVNTVCYLVWSEKSLPSSKKFLRGFHCHLFPGNQPPSGSSVVKTADPSSIDCTCQREKMKMIKKFKKMDVDVNIGKKFDDFLKTTIEE